LLAISYLNLYKCVAIFFCAGFTLILATPLELVLYELTKVKVIRQMDYIY